MKRDFKLLLRLGAFVVLWYLVSSIFRGAMDHSRSRRGPEMLSQMVLRNHTTESEVCPCFKELGDENSADIFHQFIKARAPSGVPVWLQTSRRHPNLPLDLLTGRQERPHCKILPFLLSISWRDVYWQIHLSPEGQETLLYSAHLDDRPFSDSWPSVRVLALARHGASVGIEHCQIWRNETLPPVTVPVLSQEYLHWEGRENASWNAFLISCRIPKDVPLPSLILINEGDPEGSSDQVDPPIAVSISSLPCSGPTNLLKLMGVPLTARQRRVQKISALYPQLLKPSLTMEDPGKGAEGGPANSGIAAVVDAAAIQSVAAAASAHATAILADKAFGNWEGYPWYKDMPPPSWEREYDWGVGVCGPALFYGNQELATLLVNWAEVLKSLGISRVFLYAYDGDLHEKVMEVLQHYESEEFFRVTLFTFPSPYFSFPALKRMFTETEKQKLIALETLHISDCVLRNMRDFRFLAHLDIGEIPVLPEHNTLPDLVQELYSQTILERKGIKRLMPPFYTIYAKSKGIYGGSGLGKNIYDTQKSSGLVSRYGKTCTVGLCPEPVDVDLEKGFLTSLGECEGCRTKAKEEEMRKSVLPAAYKVLKDLRLQEEGT